MTLTPGTRLGPYEIVAPLGAGGMGEVFRARDTILARDVAIKSLPEAFAQDAERLGRFEREARVLASLNHPNVAAIYGIQEADGHRYLVLEFVDGETLAARIARGPLPVEEAIDVCRQIAAGVEAAHESGVIHRDLKPGNVMIAPDGHVKVLDFGLATSASAGQGGSQSNLTHSPTLTSPATRAGVILGTAAYMSPEQARGRSLDRRTDIWSFGCILFECLTGRQLYQGETVSDLIARILEREPDWTALPANTPPRVRELLQRCLRKDAKERLRDIGDARLELDTIAKGGAEPATTVAVAPALGGRGRVWLALAAVAVAAAVVTAAFMRTRTSAPSPAFEFTLDPPAGYTFALPASPAMSPDGRTLTCCVQDSTGDTWLAMRPLDRDEMRVLPGTNDASYPFWSPDSRSIAFFARQKLNVVRLDGSVPVARTDGSEGRSGSWGKDGTIVFAPTASGPIFKVPAGGGRAVQITTLDAARSEVGHRYPKLLEDGRHFLYVAIARDGKRWLCVGNVDGGKARALRVVENTAFPAGPGWVATVEKNKVLVQRFDERRLALLGEPVTVAECGSWNKIGDPNLGTDAHGTVVYQSDLKQRGWLHWYDVGTHALGPPLCELDTPIEVALARDQHHVAVTMSSENDLWMVDLQHPVPTRLTFFNPPQLSGLWNLIWSHDSRRIAYTLEMPSTADVIHAYTIATSSDSTLFRAPGMFAVSAGWTPDRGIMAALCSDSTGAWQPWIVPNGGSGQAAPYPGVTDAEAALLSPDGRWLACQVRGGGKIRIQIVSFPHPGRRFELALDTEPPRFANPLWSADGSSLVYVDARKQVVAVPVSFEGGFRQGRPHVLFSLGPHEALASQNSDMRRFLVVRSEALSNPAPLRVLTGWPKRVGTR